MRIIGRSIRRADRPGRRGLAATTSLLALLAGAGVTLATPAGAQTLPSGGKVAAGSATIGPAAGGAMSIRQGSDKAIIDWNSFSIGAGGAVRIDNGKGATLNRVTGAGVSSIDGLLSATGSVYLLNPNGVIIGKGGVVDVGGTFVASTLGTSNAAFLAGGDLTLAGDSRASVVNLGRIGALGGDVVLAGFTVANRGTITSPGGTAGLVAGSAVVLADQADDNGRFKVVLGGAGASATNSGTIAAASAELRANGGSIYALAGNTDGVIRATGVSGQGGRIFLTAGAGGTIEVAGSTIAATGPDAMIRIGSADTGATTIADGVSITTDAGGFIETSAEQLSVGAARISAGAGGTWLLDPTDVTVDAAMASTLEGALAAGSNAMITTDTGGADVGNVTVAAPISWSGDGRLEIDATNLLTVNAPITATGTNAGLVLTYAGLDLHAPITLSGASATLMINAQAYTLIHTVDQLQAMQSNPAGHYALGNDIDASATASWNSNAGFAPVGPDNTDPFTGTLNGLGHVVSKLTIDRPDQDDVGLFGVVGLGGVVSDIGMIGGTVNGGDNVGGLVGVNSGGAVSDAYATGAVIGSGFDVGGLIGLNAGNVSDAYATGAVSGSGNVVGGLIGENFSGTVSDAYATGAVTGSGTSVGGLIGDNNEFGTVSDAYATGAASGGNAVGGLIGENEGTVSDAYATGAVTGSGSTVGGLIGFSDGNVSAGYWDQDSTGQANGIGGGGGVTGLTSATAFSASSYSFSDPGKWLFVDGVRPMLAFEWSTTITNAHQLQLMAIHPTASYTLAKDIDASATATPSDVWSAAGFVPVGADDTHQFTGALDGQGHVVTGLTIDRPDETDVGLFGSVGPSGVVSHIGMTGGAVSGSFVVGDLIGRNDGAVSDAYATGAVDGDMVGGLIGYNFTSGAVSNVYATGAVNGGQFVGGLIGASNGTVSDAYATGAVNATSDEVGGLIGVVTSGAVTGVYATGAVNSSEGREVGGLIGVNNGVVSDAYATGATSGDDYVGGLIGAATGGTVSDVYARGAVTGDTIVGGLMGLNSSALSDAYATGVVNGVTSVGGLIGFNSGTVNHSYWDIGATNQQMSAGGTGLTTQDMHDPSKFTSWNFDTVWAAPDGAFYPELYGVSGVVGIFIDSGSRTYGEASSGGGYHVVGAGVWNTLTGAPLLTSPDARADVGDYAVTGSGATATRIFGQPGPARVVYRDGMLTITPRLITVTATDQNRAYGDANRDLTYTVGGGGLVNGDALSGALTTDADATSDVGAYGIGQGSLLASSNYTVSFNSGILTIDPRLITVTATDQHRAYGDANRDLTYTVSDGGLVNGDSLSGALTTDANATSDVGAYVIGQGSLLASSNYTVRFTPGVLTVDPRLITVTATDQNRAYGDANRDLTYTFSDGGLVNGDSLSGALTTDANATSDVGAYGIDRGTLMASSNYMVSFNPGVLTVDPRLITVTAADQHRAYGDANRDLTYTVGGGGLVNGDSLSGALTTDADATSDVRVGGYGIDQGSLAASSNYAVSFTPGTLTIDPRHIEVTALGGSSIYGDSENDPGLSASNLASFDTVSDLTGLSNSFGITGASDAGTYGLDVKGVLSNANYVVDRTTGGAWTVTARPLTITADDLRRIYGEGNPDLTYTVGGGGLVNGDSLSGALATDAGAKSDVGAYGIGQGSLMASSNYTVSFTPGVLTVDPRSITLTANDATRPWGAPDPVFTYEVGGMGLVNGDSLTGALARDPGETPGDYAIGQGSLSATPNYAVSFTPGTLSVTPVLIEGGLLFERNLPRPLQRQITPPPTARCRQDMPCLLPYPANLGAGPAIHFVSAQ